MNVERLQTLAEVVRKDYHIFDDGLVLGLTMGEHFIRSERDQISFLYHFLAKEWPPSVEVNAVGCLISFTILLFGDGALLDAPFSDDWSLLNLDAEAANLLELSEDTSHELFYGCLSPTIKGINVARVIHKLLMTEEVDWFMLET